VSAPTGHDVLVADLYGGRTFDDYAPPMTFAQEEVGHEALMQRAVEAVAEVPAQTHSTLADHWREQEELEQTVRDIEAGGGTIEVFDYPGSGHLFTDPTLPAEYDAVATETFWSRVLPFVRACG
jgi:Dienelactone hydrolase family